MILTIAIPTYNRVDRLINCLNTLNAELSRLNFETEIEVIVSDNFSGDGTWEFLKDFRFINSQVDYKVFRNNSNIGAVENIRSILSQSKGTHILWCTDDDYFLPGSLNLIYGFVNELKPDYLKTSLIMYLEKTKKASFYGNNVDILNLSLSAKNLIEIFKYSHILTGTIISKKIADKWLEIDSNNCYPSSIWCALSLNSRILLATPCFMHTWENELHWDLDVKMTNSEIDRNFLLSSEQVALYFASAEIDSCEDSEVIRTYYHKNRIDLIVELRNLLPKLKLGNYIKFQVYFLLKSISKRIIPKMMKVIERI